MFETKTEPLAAAPVFYRRVIYHLAIAGLLLGICLSIGIIGYHYTAPMDWIDSLHNASMILSGMGPVMVISTTGGKVFSSFYALFSGVAFITNIGVILAPLAHRLFHRLHVDEE